MWTSPPPLPPHTPPFILDTFSLFAFTFPQRQNGLSRTRLAAHAFFPGRLSDIETADVIEWTGRIMNHKTCARALAARARVAAAALFSATLIPNNAKTYLLLYLLLLLCAHVWFGVRVARTHSLLCCARAHARALVLKTARGGDALRCAHALPARALP